MQWKYGSTNLNDLNYVKESYPVHLDEYEIENGYSDKPVFAWWVKFVMKNCDRILSKVKSKYWVRTHKYGTRFPKDVREAKQIYTDNENTLWWYAIMFDTKNAILAFEVYEGDKKDLVGYQGIK